MSNSLNLHFILLGVEGTQLIVCVVGGGGSGGGGGGGGGGGRDRGGDGSEGVTYIDDVGALTFNIFTIWCYTLI